MPMHTVDRGSIAGLLRMGGFDPGTSDDELDEFGRPRRAGPLHGDTPYIPTAGAGPEAGAGLLAVQPPQPPPPRRRGPLGRISERVKGLLGGTQTPYGYESLLTPEEQARAKPGLLGMLGNAVLGLQTPKGVIEANMGEMVERKMALKARHKEMELESRREALSRSLGPPPENPDDLNPWLRKYHAGLTAIGHPQAKDFGAILDDLQTKTTQPLALQRQDNVLIDGKPHIVWTDADGRIVRRERQYVAPKETTERQPIIHTFEEGGKNVEKISHDQGRTWQVLGNTKATSGDIRVSDPDKMLAVRDAESSMKALADPKDATKLRDPPGWFNRVATKSEWTNWAATGSGQSYMNNVRRLVRSWVVTVEGKRMSDADARVNEMLRSFRFGAGKEADEDTKRTLQQMAAAVKERGEALQAGAPGAPKGKTKTIVVNGKTFIVPD